MSSPSDESKEEGDREVSSEELERLLDRTRPVLPFSRGEIFTLRSMIADYEYGKRSAVDMSARKDKWGKVIPWIFSGVATLIALGTLVLNLTKHT